MSYCFRASSSAALTAAFLLTGCTAPAIRYTAGSPLACGKRYAAEDYCANFSATPELKTDPAMDTPRTHCLEFYRQAIRSTNLLCSYFSDLDHLTVEGEGRDSPTLSAIGKSFDRKYAALAEEQGDALDRAYRLESRVALEAMSNDGRRELAAEENCRARTWQASSLLLLGVAAQARKDETATYERIRPTLRSLERATRMEAERSFLALRSEVGVERGGEQEQRAPETLVASRQSEPTLLALGFEQVPDLPGAERVYAQAQHRAAGIEEPYLEAGPDRAGGRSLASVAPRCPLIVQP